jgi:hypothetical protein
LAVELSIPSGSVGLEAASDTISAVLADLLGQDTAPRLRVEVRDLANQWIEVALHASQVQVLQFVVPESPAGPRESHLNIAVADRTPLGIALMLATAIVLAERDDELVEDEAALFGAVEYDPSELRRKVRVSANGMSLQSAARSLCTRFGLAATASSAKADP